ncbi:NAD(P)-dependent oxidoreductase [Paeniroseomonas aquatica]|uniref:NAD(P)-dependent oxidoreductase n=1 Tax=Paeniroseomonas aquatica TaxID=373043 RepID=A0ABT8A6A3_9PROT|nr:NAD(P)-dependent oxidoreductase [Paeniroseomonas aquatica]MDN3565063.1 NAD(P)-dependent oxidoreductase [Paeniroseomonas aquatica]
MTRLHVQVNPASMLAGEITEERVRAGAAAFGDGLALSFGTTPAALEAGLAEAEVLLLTGKAPLEDLGRRAPRLRWLSYTSAGVEWLVDTDFPPRLQLTNASGTHEPKAAEFTLMAVLMLNNHLPQLLAATRERRWAPRSGGTVAGRTALILGMGALGGAAATALQRQGMRIIGNSHGGRPHPAVAVMTTGEGFRAHLPEADVLVIALPLTAATRGLIGRAELDLLPRHAGVVNIGRGEILDDAALAAKLREGSLGGAVLDALPQEPLPPDSPLWDTPNLIITPHCGLYDPTAYGPRCLDGFFANLRRFQAGEPLAHRVLPDRGY